MEDTAGDPGLTCVCVCVCAVTERYNASLVFCPSDSRLLFSVREPIVNRVFFSSRQRGFARRSAQSVCERVSVCVCV